MEEGSLDRVLVDVAGEIVALSRRDQGALLQELCVLPECKAIRRTFETSGNRVPIRLDREQRSRLRPVLEVWERDGLPPPGIASLLAALVRVNPSGQRR